MEKYNLHMSRDVYEQVTSCMLAYVERNEWLTVKVLGSLIGADLSIIFGNGNLGWSPSTLRYSCQATATACSAWVSMPRPEEIPACSDGHTVRDLMEEDAGCERPTLKDWLNKNGIGIHNGAVPYEKAYMQDTLAILRRMVEDRRTVRPELIEHLTEMRTLIHTLIGTGENCCDATVSESAEAVRKATRLDAMDALRYAITALYERKGSPGVKRALNSIYGTAAYDGARLADALKHAASASQESLRNAVSGSSEDACTPPLAKCECENVRADDPNALFVYIDTGTFDATLENVEAVRSFISDNCEGRDIHLRIT